MADNKGTLLIGAVLAAAGLYFFSRKAEGEPPPEGQITLISITAGKV